LLAGVWLGGCAGDDNAPSPTQTVAAATSAPGAEGEAQLRASSVVSGAQAGAAGGVEVVAAAPLTPTQATPPVRLQIPQIGLDVPVEAMGWAVVMADGARTTVWQTPEDAAGWHVNSAGAGGHGRTVISGRQTGEGQVFAPIALGSAQAGQTILLTGFDGVNYAYTVTEVTDPIPLAGATPEEEAETAAFVEPTDDAQLVLISGWPDFTTTHRVFVLADFAGVAP
jgi:hypothetical protein